MKTSPGEIVEHPPAVNWIRIQDFGNLLVLVVLNLMIVWRLFSIDYLPHFSSIAGAFIGIAETISKRETQWWPYWHAGIPWETVYVPALHRLVALFHQLTQFSTPQAYNIVTALFYAAGPISLYICTRGLGAGPRVAFLGCLLYSTFSPSAVLITPIFNDLGGIHSGQRLRVLTVYGEGPHIAALTLIPLALLAFQHSFRNSRFGPVGLAAILFAAVVATNTPGTIALLFSLVILIFSQKEVMLPTLKTMVGIAWGGLTSLMLVAPIYWITVVKNNEFMHPGFNRSQRKWVVLLGVLLLTGLFSRFMDSWPLYFKFFSLLALFFGLVSSSGHSGAFELIPQAGRFHLEFELGACVVCATLFDRAYSEWWPPFKPILALCLLSLLSLFLMDLKTVRRKEQVRVDITKRSEYQLAKWANQNLAPSDGRIQVSGSTSFWFKTFSDLPQVTGCCDQGRVSIVPAGIADLSNSSQSSEQIEMAILWMRAFRVQALIAPGPDSTDAYPLLRPEKFKPFLPVLYENNGSIIYGLTGITRNLAAVVSRNKLVTTSLDRGSEEFTRQLTGYVSELSRTKPIQAEWTSPAELRIHVNMPSTEVVTVGVNYLEGWTASTNGQPLSIKKDSLGFIVLDPSTGGERDITLTWKGAEFSTLAKGLGCIAGIAAILAQFSYSMKQAVKA